MSSHNLDSSDHDQDVSKLNERLRNSLDAMSKKQKIKRDLYDKKKFAAKLRTSFQVQSGMSKKIQPNSRQTERNSFLMSPLSTRKDDNISINNPLSVMSHISPRSPQRILFSNQPLQIYTDLQKIHRQLDQAEISYLSPDIIESEPAKGLKRQKIQRMETLRGKAQSIINELQSKFESDWNVLMVGFKSSIRALPAQNKEYQQLL